VKEKGKQETLIEVFDQRINKYIDDREEEIRTPFEKFINEFRLLTEQWK